jgi:transposase-like protein
MIPTVNQLNHVYANNRAKVSNQPTRQQERAMRGFTAPAQTQRFLTLHGVTQNRIRVGRHLWQAVN